MALTPKLITSAIWLALTATATQAAGEIYCCPDPASGRRVCADTLPDQCRGRAYRVLDSNGNVIKEVGPPLTPEQKAEQVAEAKRLKKVEEAAREQRRRDQALLDTYATRQDIDLAQEKAESDIKLAIQDANAAIVEISRKRKKFDNEAEFYKKKTLPVELAKELRALDHETKLQLELIEVKKQEFAIVRAKYEADRLRFDTINGGATKATRSAPSGGSPAPR
jgi:hypothetical protein